MPDNARPYTNRGEYRTYHLLHDLKLAHPKDEMQIYSNLFLESDFDLPNRQVDHLVVSRRGIFLLETKYWRGTIYHEVTKRQLEVACGVYWPMISASFPPAVAQLSMDVELTIVASPGDDTSYHVGFADPAKQADRSRRVLQSILKAKVGRLPYVHDLVLYVYPHGENDRVVDINDHLDAGSDWLDGFSDLAHFKCLLRASNHGSHRRSALGGHQPSDQV